MNNTIKLHFRSSKRAIAASIDGSCTAGERTRSGKIKTWVAHVYKLSPSETTEQAYKRIMGE